MSSSTTISVLMISSRADYGGGPEHVYRLIQNLKGRCRIYAAIPNDKPYFGKISRLIGTASTLTIPHRKFSAAALSAMVTFIKKNNIRIVHSHGKGAGTYSRLAAFLTGAKCVHTFHGIHTEKYNASGSLGYRMYEKISSFFTHSFIATGDGELARIKKFGFAPLNKITLIKNGVNIPERFAGFPESNGINLLTITRNDPVKNPALLIPILKELTGLLPNHKIMLNIVGHGFEDGGLASLFDAAGLSQNYTLLPPLPELTDVFLSSFCYLSTSKMEGLPLSVLEAQSYGLPCVVTDVPGNADIVTNKVNGYLFRPENPEDAARAIAGLTADRELWNLLSENSKNYIKQNFSVQKMADSVYTLYASLTGTRP